MFINRFKVVLLIALMSTIIAFLVWNDTYGDKSSSSQTEESVVITPIVTHDEVDTLYAVIMDCAAKTHPEESKSAAQDFYQCAFSGGQVIIVSTFDMTSLHGTQLTLEADGK